VAAVAALLGVAAVATAGCEATPGATSVDIGGGTRITVPVTSFKDLRDRNVVRQAFDYSCGAAALATLLTYGLNDPISEREVVAEILRTLDADEETLRKKEGFSLLDMQRVAERRGFRAQGFRIAPDFLDKLQGPVIVFIRPRGYEHFAVLRGVRGDQVFLADPSLGNVRRPDYAFLDMWLGEDGRGIIFVVEPAGAAPVSVPLLAVRDAELRRPELMSARQLLEVGRTAPLAGSLR
jgi:predicted double-glycine peptidase